ncbi:MAG: DUF4825 domain-containing protein [Peptococcaceae bacterium]|jgi:beta-lactamase regulating signal transducer with metallopeptidase domain|nr:DUF4825 domain-containing protein [Peptococcaceae bacterium]
MIEQLFLTLLTLSATTSAVILLLGLASGLFNKNYAAKWKYWLWLALAARLFLPFNITLPTAPVEVRIPNAPMREIINIAPALPPAAANEIPEIATQAAQASPITLLNVLMLLWLAGALAFLAYHMIGYFIFRKNALRWSKVPADGRIAATLAKVAHDLGIKNEITILTSAKISSPLMTGFAKPLLLLPHEDYSATDLKFILHHELTHFKRHDIWYKLFMLIVNAVHWFNPCAYLMFREASADLELSCDDNVTHGLTASERRDYSEIILASITRQRAYQTPLSTYFYGGAKTMKNRFKNILNPNKKKNGVSVFLAMILCVVVASGFIACSTIVPTQSAGSAGHTQQLYAYKDTPLGDATKVRAIAEITKSAADYDIQEITFETTNHPYGVTITYKVPDRNVYNEHRSATQQLDYAIAAQLFVLIPDAEFVWLCYSDAYQENFDYTYLTEPDLIGYEPRYTAELLRNAAQSPSGFDTFYETVLSISAETETEIVSAGQTKGDKILAAIGPDKEIVANSGLNVTLEPTAANQAKMARYGLVDNEADIAKSREGATLEFQTYSVSDFAGENWEGYLFVFAESDLVGYRKLPNDSETLTVFRGLSE